MTAQHTGVPPFPIVVGVPRSGTTLLRLMLDAHPQLAIPPETGFLSAPQIATGSTDPCEIADQITKFPFGAPAWQDFGIAYNAFLASVQALPATAGLPEVLRVFYRLYAERHAKPRSGDKTPLYVAHMATVAAALPEARFIHIVRDGRDVALSWSRTWFAPSRDLPELVGIWAATIRQARSDAAGLHYLEVRYEHLVREPEWTLAAICRFIELNYCREMLTYHTRSAERLREHADRFTTDGTLVISQAQRLRQQWRTQFPPQHERISAWKAEMSPAQIELCEQRAGGLLELDTIG